MKFAIKFYKGCRIEREADELIIQYKEKNPNLIKFVQERDSNQRIVIDVTELADIEDNLSILAAARQAHPQFAVLVSQDQNFFIFEEEEIPFFFLEGASNLGELEGILRVGVSDIYITNDLAFNLKNVSAYCHNQGVQVRVYPNVAQSSTRLFIEPLTKFFIRPDAVRVYEPYVDVFEFFGPLDRQPVLYDIYKDERWLGQLNEVILDLDKEIDNQTIVPYFDVLRTNCKRECGLDMCGVCLAVEKLGKTLQTKEIGIRKKKANEGNEYKVDEISLSAESVAVETDIGELSSNKI